MRRRHDRRIRRDAQYRVRTVGVGIVGQHARCRDREHRVLVHRVVVDGGRRWIVALDDGRRIRGDACPAVRIGERRLHDVGEGNTIRQFFRVVECRRRQSGEGLQVLQAERAAGRAINGIRQDSAGMGRLPRQPDPVKR